MFNSNGVYSLRKVSFVRFMEKFDPSTCSRTLKKSKCLHISTCHNVYVDGIGIITFQGHFSPALADVCNEDGTGVLIDGC